MVTWIIAGGRVVGDLSELIAIREGMDWHDRLRQIWPKNATADEVATALERLAASIRTAE